MDQLNSLEIKNLFGGYEDKNIFKDFSISIPKNCFIAIAGPNGAGKSTLLKYWIKELKAQDKTVFVFNQDINDLKQIKLAKSVSLVAQNVPKDYEFTVKEFTELGRFCHNDTSSSSGYITKALQITGIEHLADKRITKISGGEFQMAVLARAICQDTEIILLDEPINNLDPYHQIKILKLLKELSQTGKTIICILHDLNSILSYSDYCILLKEGKIHSQGKTEQVLTEEAIKEVYNIDCKLISQGYDHTPLAAYYNL